MAAKTTACFTSLKEALLIHTRHPKLFALVLLLLAVTAFLVPLTHVMSVQPLADDMARGSHLIQIRNTGPFSAEYARLLNEIKHDVMKLAIVNIVLQVVMPALGFVRQIIAFLMASTIYFADRYSLVGVMCKAVNVYGLKGPSITIALVALLGTLLSAVMRLRSWVLSVLLLTFLLAFLIFATGASIRKINIESICA
uniref:Uncharacterized protein n=1 Tax=Avena sativa TaxID=4498 RepID=A0ACD5Y3Q5_AVESA